MNHCGHAEHPIFTAIIPSSVVNPHVTDDVKEHMQEELAARTGDTDSEDDTPGVQSDVEKGLDGGNDTEQ